VTLGLTEAQDTVGAGFDQLISIENLIGSGFADTLNGDMYDNVIDGGGGDDVIAGNSGNDTLRGGSGNDVLNGGKGNDILIGGRGADTLTGGAGADHFVFLLGDSGVEKSARDRITDFAAADGDRIDLSGIDAITGGGDDAFTLVTEFTGVAGQLTTRAMTGGYVVEGDINGDGVADFSIAVFTTAPLGADAFIL
jgi:Ca2+-binding RTX toxin-like protein